MHYVGVVVVGVLLCICSSLGPGSSRVAVVVLENVRFVVCSVVLGAAALGRYIVAELRQGVAVVGLVVVVDSRGSSPW